VFAYVGREDSEAPAAEAAGWSRQTSGGFCQRVFPGGHFFVRSAKNEVLERLAQDLGELPSIQM
jgi:surfactin synthase thioesterase subunit